MIQQAITMGYTAAQILKFISSKFKSSSSGITNAQKQGYDDEEILRFLSGKIKPKNKKNLDNQLSSQEKYLKSVGINTKEEKSDTRNRFLSSAIGTGITAIGAYNTYKNYDGMLKGLGQTFGLGGTSPNPLNNSETSARGMPAPGPNAETNPELTPNGFPIRPQDQQNQQPPAPEPIPLDSSIPEDQAIQNIQDRQSESNRLFELASQPKASRENMTPFMQTARVLVKKGDIKDADTFDSFRKYWTATEGKPRGGPLAEFEKFRVSQPREQKISTPEIQANSEMTQLPTNDRNNVTMSNSDMNMTESPLIRSNNADLRENISQNEIKDKNKPIQKNDLTFSPQGLGTVKGIHNGKAIVDIDGKNHLIDESDLQASPIAEKDLADLYDDMIGGIEKHTGKDVSRNVEWAGYDPKTNEMAYRPHGGGFYVYDNISPEDAGMLEAFLTKRKTTGSNFIGAWEAGSDSPMGAGMSQLIVRLQKERGGKGNEYRNRFDTIYDAIEPARSASKEKKKLSAKLESERKKAEKNAEKENSKKEIEVNKEIITQKPIVKEVSEKQPINESALKKEDRLFENLDVAGKKILSGEVLTKNIVARPDLMQFKKIEESSTGENANDLLKGKFDSLKSGVLLLWEPENPSKYDMKDNQKYIVSNGHHRLAFAKRENEPKMLTRIIREKDGYSASDAMRIGAEINIAEGRGSVHDQAKYFRNLITTLGEDKANTSAERTGRPGERAWTVAANAGDELYRAFIHEEIKPEQAEAIADSTKDKNRQLLGLKFARDGKNADQIKNLLQASNTIKTKPSSQMDLFGFDDSAFKAMEEMSEAASKIQKDINQRINAITGASKHPGKAKEYGIDVKDPQQVKKAKEFLLSEKDKWKNWSLHSELVDQVKQSMKD